MLEDFGHSTWGDLSFLPNIFFQINHLGLLHPVRAFLSPAENATGSVFVPRTVASRMTTDRACQTVGMKDVAVAKADPRQGGARLKSAVRCRGDVHLTIVGYSASFLGTAIHGGCPVPPFR